MRSITRAITAFLILTISCAAQSDRRQEHAEASGKVKQPSPLPVAEKLTPSQGLPTNTAAPAPEAPSTVSAKPTPTLNGRKSETGTPSRQVSTPQSTTREMSPSRFSDLALFFFGSGFAVFVALLGWSDQIRGLRKETQELQTDFLRQNDLSRADLLPVVLATTPDEQLESFTKLMRSGKLGSASAVRYLPLLRLWHEQTTRLEKIQNWKYRLTVLLSVTFFISGSLLVAGISESLVVFPPAVLIVTIFSLMIVANRFEQRLHTTLRKMMEHV